MSKGTIKKVAGPLVIAEGMRDSNMFDVVRVSNQRLIGEIIEMHGDEASVQVYEETSGLGPGEPVESMNAPLSVELGPGLITSIYDGIQRPLDEIMKVSGTNLKRGVEVPSLKRNKKWNFVPTVKVGDEVQNGDIIGTVQETIVVNHKIMVPYGINGKVKEIKAGEFTVEEIVAVIETADGDKEVGMMQTWPVRKGRPYLKKLPPEMELFQRLGWGRGTVREAFRLLQAKGVVEIKPGRGAFVAENPAERDIGAIDWLVENERELRDSIEIRTALEPMAARRMAERCNTEDIRRLENIHRSFLSAIQEGDAAMIGRLDEQFHSAIVESSGNALMIEINSHVCQGMQTFRSKTFQVEQNVKNAVMPHSNIMNAILARDAAQAEREMRAHLDKVQEDLTQNIHAPGHETK